MTERFEAAEDALTHELMVFIEEAVARILENEDEGELFAWVRAEAPRRLPGLFADLPNEAAARAVAFEIAREIWNLVPLPDAGYRTRPIPRPERNAPCPCGSGQKHKKCCGAVSIGRIELPFQAEDAWALVLAESSEEEVAQLSAEKRVPRALIPGIADRLAVYGDPEMALSLLEPLFEQPERLDERDALAVDALIEAYDALGFEEAKERAIARLDQALRPALRLVLWEALARSFTGHGEAERAWEAVAHVRRLDPDSPVLDSIEVILLLGENRLEEAADRARLALENRGRRPGLSEEGMTLLEETAKDPAASRRRLVLDDLLPAVERFEKLLATLAGRPIQPYSIHPEGEIPGAGRLVPPEDLLAVEKEWVDVAYVGMMEGEEPDWDEDDDWDEEDEEDEDWEEDSEEEGEGAEDDDDEEAWELDPYEGDEDDWLEDTEEVWGSGADAWLTFLEETPRVFDSFLVLRDLVARATALADQRDPGLRDRLIGPLVDRGVAILEASLAGAPQVTLPIRLEGNLPALELLAESASIPDESLPDQAALELLLQLDPEDGLAVRGLLGTAYLWEVEPQKVLDLADRFPEDDEPGLPFARVVALWRLQRKDEALAALDEAVDRFPIVAVGVSLGGGRIPDALLDLWENEEELSAELRKRVGGGEEEDEEN